MNADSVIAGVGGDIRGYNLYSYCMNNPVNMSDEDGNWPKWVKKVAKAVAVAAVVTIVVAATAGVAAMALGASATVAAGVFTGALAGGAVASTVNIGIQMKKKGANKVSSKEAAKSAFYGASSGAVSGGVSMGSTAAKSATQILVHKGIQAGANMTISTSAYIMQTSFSGNEMSLYGTGVSALGGFVSGVTFNAPMGQALGISLGLELAGNGEELISIFGEKHKNRR